MRPELTTEEREKKKPLVMKAYGSIPHLPNSRLGDGDRYITFGQADILTHKVRDKHDIVIVQEKLDGSCCGVANIKGEIVPIMRAGWACHDSKYEHLVRFDKWAKQHEPFLKLGLKDGERIMGEWLALAHGTIYDLQNRCPFVAFDIMTGHERLTYEEFFQRCQAAGIITAPLINKGPIPVDAALEIMGDNGRYGATEPAEGLVYRVERRGKVDFLAKFVKQDKIDGKYFPQISGKDFVWLV